MIGFERRLEKPRLALVLIPMVSVIAALILGWPILAANGHHPFQVHLAMLHAGFTDGGVLSTTLLNSTP